MVQEIKLRLNGLGRTWGGSRKEIALRKGCGEAILFTRSIAAEVHKKVRGWSRTNRVQKECKGTKESAC